MTKEEYELFLEQALKNLKVPSAQRFNIKGEVSRLVKLYTVEEMKEKQNKQRKETGINFNFDVSLFSV